MYHVSPHQTCLPYMLRSINNSGTTPTTPAGRVHPPAFFCGLLLPHSVIAQRFQTTNYEYVHIYHTSAAAPEDDVYSDVYICAVYQVYWYVSTIQGTPFFLNDTCKKNRPQTSTVLFLFYFLTYYSVLLLLCTRYQVIP